MKNLELRIKHKKTLTHNSEFSTLNSSKGFTLIELMVAIAIIAILATVGISLFSSAQKGARDTRRGDITAITNALETNKIPGSAAYTVLAGTQFASGSIPVDSGNGDAKYCAAVSTTASAPPAAASGALEASGCAAGYTEINTSTGAPFISTTASWTVCARLENGTNAYLCKQSAQ